VMNEKPTRKSEKAWLSRVADHGCVATRQSNIQLHHSVGREGKQNKYHIGRWFVLPLAFDLHDVSSNEPLNITHHRKSFIEYYGLESKLFFRMCKMLENDGPLPFNADVMAAIQATRR